MLVALSLVPVGCAGGEGPRDAELEGSGGDGSGGSSPSGGATGGDGSGGNSEGGGATGGSAAGGDGSGGGSEGGGESETGGTAGSGGVFGAGGEDGTGGESGTISVVLSDYVSRKWARWPIPNPPSLGLPNPMSYTQTADGVLDQVTGLVWQETTNASTTNWADALAYCEGLGEGWSLPTRIELTTIVNHAVSGGKVDSEFFSFGAGAGWTWASTPWVVNQRRNLMGDAALSWFINFALGDSNNSLSQTATSAYSRCVRIPSSRDLPAEHYLVTAEEVVDQYTGLTWQRGHSSDAPHLSFEGAFSYCEALNLSGQTWRLPTVSEIASIVDDVPSGDVSPATDHDVFPETAPDAQYWSQSPYGTNTDEHWTLNFEDGFTAHRTNDTNGIARCVR